MKNIELDDVYPELAKQVRDLIVASNEKGLSIDERITIKQQAWDLIPDPKTQFYTPTGSLALAISDCYRKLQDYKTALTWILLALEAREDMPDVTVMIDAGITYYELSDMENAYKYFDITYDMDKYSPFAGEDKKYWQFYKAEKENRKSKK